jgi:hypothetical protein
MSKFYAREKLNPGFFGKAGVLIVQDRKNRGFEEKPRF